jgi:hypothetical protein
MLETGIRLIYAKTLGAENFVALASAIFVNFSTSLAANFDAARGVMGLRVIRLVADFTLATDNVGTSVRKMITSQAFKTKFQLVKLRACWQLVLRAVA